MFILGNVCLSIEGYLPRSGDTYPGGGGVGYLLGQAEYLPWPEGTYLGQVMQQGPCLLRLLAKGLSCCSYVNKYTEQGGFRP